MSLAFESAQAAIKKSGVKNEDIDCIIVATASATQPIPSMASIVSNKLGIAAPAFDLNAACSGFVYALNVAAGFFEMKLFKNVLLVGVDTLSAVVDKNDRSTAILFGDGAGAVLLEPTTEDLGVKDFILKADGAGRNYLCMHAGGSVLPPSHETVDARKHYVYQEGQAVFKFAVKGMADVSAEILEKNNLKADDIKWLVPHQANKRIVDATADRMGIGAEKVMMNIERYGNTTAGTIPLLLWDYEKQLKKGDNLIISAFGGGFTWGSVWLKWAYDTK